jgi:hypothetical protein
MILYGEENDHTQLVVFLTALLQVHFECEWSYVCKCIFIFFNKSCLSRFEFETSNVDTMLNYYILTNSPKNLIYLYSNMTIPFLTFAVVRKDVSTIIQGVP